MLVRFTINNMYSFGDLKEFNMFPAPRLRVKKEHKYSINNSEILKMASIYGANGAGKSNLIKSLLLLRDIILNEQVPSYFHHSTFKFNSDEEKIPQVLVIEFIQENKSFLYGLEILNNIILTEELYISGMGESEDTLLYERKFNTKDSSITINSPLFDDEKGKLLKEIIEDNLSEPSKPLFKFLTKLKNSKLLDIKIALDWFENTLRIISPNSKPVIPLVQVIDQDVEYKTYVKDLMSSFSVGISSIDTVKTTLEDFFGQNEKSAIEQIKLDYEKKVGEDSDSALIVESESNDEIMVTKENDKYIVTQVLIEHIGKDGKKSFFDLDEESDGTVRLLDFAPAFNSIVNQKKVFLIDEIERSIHPLLIKELIRKFADNNNTHGQLIFSTHESNLLDLDIFRQDEIWFAEKDFNGCTDLYVLSDFKEHNTIDIRKGYLSGRYGSIPFLGNLKDLQWNSNDIEK